MKINDSLPGPGCSHRLYTFVSAWLTSFGQFICEARVEESVDFGRKYILNDGSV